MLYFKLPQDTYRTEALLQAQRQKNIRKTLWITVPVSATSANFTTLKNPLCLPSPPPTPLHHQNICTNNAKKWNSNVPSSPYICEVLLEEDDLLQGYESLLRCPTSSSCRRIRPSVCIFWIVFKNCIFIKLKNILKKN